MNTTRSLELRFFNYFLLITIAAIMIGFEFYLELGRPDLQSDICTISGENENLYAFSGLQKKIVIMFGVLSIVAAIVLLMFVKTISMPLRRMVSVAGKINEGDLRQIIHSENNDEIGQLGNVINDLASNLQEIAESSSIFSEKIDAGLQKLKRVAEQQNDTKCIELLNNMQGDIDELKFFIKSFDLLVADVAE